MNKADQEFHLLIRIMPHTDDSCTIYKCRVVSKNYLQNPSNLILSTFDISNCCRVGLNKFLGKFTIRDCEQISISTDVHFPCISNCCIKPIVMRWRRKGHGQLPHQKSWKDIEKCYQLMYYLRWKVRTAYRNVQGSYWCRGNLHVMGKDFDAMYASFCLLFHCTA